MIPFHKRRRKSRFFSHVILSTSIFNLFHLGRGGGGPGQQGHQVDPDGGGSSTGAQGTDHNSTNHVNGAIATKHSSTKDYRDSAHRVDSYFPHIRKHT